MPYEKLDISSVEDVFIDNCSVPDGQVLFFQVCLTLSDLPLSNSTIFHSQTSPLYLSLKVTPENKVLINSCEIPLQTPICLISRFFETTAALDISWDGGRCSKEYPTKLGTIGEFSLFLTNQRFVDYHLLRVNQTDPFPYEHGLNPISLIPNNIITVNSDHMKFDVRNYIAYNPKHSLVLTIVTKSVEFDECYDVTFHSWDENDNLIHLQVLDLFLKLSCIHPLSSFTVQVDSTLMPGLPVTTTLFEFVTNQTGLILLNLPFTYEIQDSSKRFPLANWAPPQNSTFLYPLSWVVLETLPLYGSIVDAAMYHFLPSVPIDVTQTTLLYSPSFPPCTYEHLSDPSLPLQDYFCPITPSPSLSFTDSFKVHLINSQGRLSDSAIRLLEVSAAIYPAQNVVQDVPAMFPHNLGPGFVFPTTDANLKEYNIVIHSLPTKGYLSCFEQTINDSSKLIELTQDLIPFVSNQTCLYNATTFQTSFQSDSFYDTFQWSYVHKTHFLGSAEKSTSQIRSFRVNKAPSVALIVPTYWAQVGKTNWLNLTITDEDWLLPLLSHAEMYTVHVASRNPRVALYPSEQILALPDTISSNSQVTFTSTSKDINSLLEKGISFTGSQTSTTEIVMTILNTDVNTWVEIQPKLEIVFTVNTLVGHQDATTKKSVNDVIKNSAVLLVIVISVPILIIIIVVVIFVRRKLRRSALEKQRQNLIEQKLKEMENAKRLAETLEPKEYELSESSRIGNSPYQFNQTPWKE